MGTLAVMVLKMTLASDKSTDCMKGGKMLGDKHLSNILPHNVFTYLSKNHGRCKMILNKKLDQAAKKKAALKEKLPPFAISRIIEGVNRVILCQRGLLTDKCKDW